MENGKSDLPNEPTKGNESVGTRTCISKENIPAETKQSSSVECIGNLSIFFLENFCLWCYLFCYIDFFFRTR